MATFVDYNPRSCIFVDPLEVKDGRYVSGYKKMALRCAFPAAFQNGIYHMLVGILIVCTVATGLLGNRTNNTTAMLLLVGGFAVGIVLAILYYRFMQLKIVFPRGGCMLPEGEKPKALTWAIALVFFVGFGAYALISNGRLGVPITAGCACALVELVAYIRSGRNSLLYASFFIVAIPVLLVFIHMLDSTNAYQAAVTTLSYEGIVFVIMGSFLTQKATIPGSLRHNRERLREHLSSEDRHKRFLAASFVCTSLDPDLLPEILRCCMDEDPITAYTAQIALGNTWGPKPSNSYVSTEIEFRDDVSEEFRDSYLEQAKSNKESVIGKWRFHYKLIEEKLADIAREDGVSAEALYAIAHGRGVYYENARVVALEMLGSMRTPRAYATLMDMLQHKSKHLATAAATGFFGADSKAVLYLEQFFTGSRSWIRKRAIYATRKLLDYLEMFDEGEAAVAYALLEPDVEGLFGTYDTCTFAATIELLPCYGPEDEEILRAYYSNLRPLIRVEALWTMARAQVEGINQIVLQATHDPSAAVRYTAILCMEKLHMPERLETFHRMTTDGNPRVAELARQAFERTDREVHPEYIF